MPARSDRYDEIYRSFRWKVPARLNLAEVCCTRWARETPDAPAVLYEHEDGTSAVFTYADLQQAADRLSNALARHGIVRGDRVAIVMPQRFETAVANMAVQQLGATAMPLSMLFGPEALEYRLVDSDTRLAIADESSIDHLLAARPKCPRLETVIAVGGAQGRGDVDFNAALHASARLSRLWRRTPTTRRCSSTPAAPPARRRARSSPIARCSAT